VRDVVCGMWCAGCGVRDVVCGMLGCDVRDVVCGTSEGGIGPLALLRLHMHVTGPRLGTYT
jgi:hypothetical protein